ncbi:MAG: hypothetical protein ACRCS8_06250 [Brevinema sp.]
MIFSFGTFLLIVVLFYYALILLSDTILLKIKEHQHLAQFESMLEFLGDQKVKELSGYGAFLLSLWNFFAPDFGSVYGGLTLIGALIPSTMLFLDSLILTPDLRNWIPFLSKFEEKLDRILEVISPIAGWLTLGIGVVHSLFSRVPFL